MSEPDSDHEREDPPGPSDAPGGVSDAAMRSAIAAVFFCGLCFTVVAFAFFDARTGLGVLVGGLIATLNLWVFARVGEAFMARRGNTAPWGAVAMLKLVLLFGGGYLLLHSGLISGVSLAVGYGALPFGVTIASLFGPRPAEMPGDPGEPSSTESARRDRDVIKRRRAGSDDPDSPS